MNNSIFMGVFFFKVMMKIEEISVEKTFDNAASDYEKTRPAYVSQIFQDILEYKSIGKESAVLEIGTGTGAFTIF